MVSAQPEWIRDAIQGEGVSGGKIPTTATRLDTDFIFVHREPKGLAVPHYTDPFLKRLAMDAKDFFAFIPSVNNHIYTRAPDWTPGASAPSASSIGIY